MRIRGIRPGRGAYTIVAAAGGLRRGGRLRTSPGLQQTGVPTLHAVTKILVVFAVVLSLLLSALTVAYSANAERIKSQYSAIQERANSYQAELQREQSKQAEDRARLQAEIDSVNQQLNATLTEKSSLQQESTRLLADLKQSQVELQGVQARIDQLAAMSQTQAMLISNYRDELSKLREDELRSKQREIQLADQINDLAGQLEVAIETNRALQEQLAELQQAAGGGTALASGTRPALGQPVRARVTNVRQAPNGKLMAEIDAGTNDRLGPGVELTIVQDDKFAGVLMLTSVELNEAIGEIKLNQGRQIQPGAVVTTIR